MPNKKEATSASPQDEELEHRVDAMMEPERPGDKPLPSSDKPTIIEPTKPAAPPAIDIFGDTKTAPEVSPNLLEQIGVKPAEPTSAQPEAAAPVLTAAPATEVALDDPGIDEAVDDIVAKDSDALLAAEDAKLNDGAPPTKPPVPAHKRANPFKHKWTWLLLVAVLLIAVFAVPVTRYKVLGLVIKKSVPVTVLDSVTHTPVSSALVQAPGSSVKTDANGKATIRVPVGKHQLSVTKQYYRDTTQTVTVGLGATKASTIRLFAMGRQVPITVVNKINGQPLANAEIKVLNTSAKTNKQGHATIVLPTTRPSDPGSVSLGGYNTKAVVVSITSSVSPANTFSLTPSGTVYFLSNESGTIDVVKTNLDGTNRKTVLKGTGSEDPNNTVLLASRNWQYMVLKSQRDSAQPSLYLIDSATDKASGFDSGNASFNLIGWYGHNFVYDETKNNVATSQNGHELLKSYDADRGQLNQLDQNQADGDTVNYAYQGFYNFYLLNNLVLYTTQWYSNGTVDLGNKTDGIRGVAPNGQNKKDYQTFDANGTGYLQAALYEPNSVYYSRYDYNDNKTTFYKYEEGIVSNETGINQSAFTKVYPTYLVSPSGNQTLWSELRDGKNTVFTGDGDAAKPKQLAGLTDFSAYGWYGENYALVSKGNSELYVVSVNHTSKPLKVTDYYKSAQPLVGYGYGYGGL